MPFRFILALLAAALLAPAAFAQRRGGSGHFGGGSHNYLRHHRGAVPAGYFLGDTPFFYNDYPFDPAIPEYAPPQNIVMQAAPDAPSEAKTAPLLIELQGDRYVRYGGTPEPSQRDAPAAEIPAHQTTPSLPPTVLVYRDGHREEVPDYAIVGRVIYAHTSNNGLGGYGLNNIQVSALDIPATERANRDHGVRFVLPAGPNEVVTRP